MSKASALSKKLNKISAALQKRYGSYVHFEFDDFIEAMMHQILALGADTNLAQKTLEAIHQEFVDWNDMRMATIREVQDILGEDYPRCREKAEDVINLLADLYTAFRKMKINEIAPTEEGMQTLRALPETTLVRRDMVEHALYVVFNIPTFACDKHQFETLKLLGGLPKDTELEDGLFEITQAIVEEQVELDDIRQLSHGLRCHTDFLMQYEIYDPKPIGYGWDKADPLGMKVAKFKSEIKELAKIDAVKPAPKPMLAADIAAAAAAANNDDDEEEIELEEPEGDAPVVKVVGVDDEGNEVELPGNTIEPLQDPDEAKAPEPEPAPEPVVEAEPAKEKAPKKAAAKKEAAPKKEPAKKAAAPKKEAAKKAAPKKAAAPKKEAAKKAATKKTAAKKTAAPKKEAAKKAAPKKAAAKKTATKKAAAPKKTAAKKTAAKKTAAKKDSAKKSAPKKAAAKKSTKKK